MLENLYTTKMSANKKILQNRFTKIHSKSGRLSKIMALIMSMVIAITMLCATAVMAAVGNDGLEHWDKEEIYFLRSMSFEVNILGKNVPNWVKEDVAGTDGNITVTIRHYQMRRAISGRVCLHTIAELTGTNGTTKLYSVGGGYINKAALWDSDGNLIQGGVVSSFDYPYTSSYDFVQVVEDGGLFEYVKPFVDENLINVDSNKRKYAQIDFGIDKEMNIQGIRLGLRLADENSFFEKSNDEFDLIDAPLSSLDIVGANAEEFLNTKWLSYFTEYEDNYINIDNQAVNISIKEASPKQIIINTDIALENAKHIEISVLNSEGNYVRVYREDVPDKEVILRCMDDYSEHEQEFRVGEKYRICIGVIDDNENLLYRWQEYVTIK